MVLKYIYMYMCIYIYTYMQNCLEMFFFAQKALCTSAFPSNPYANALIPSGSWSSAPAAMWDSGDGIAISTELISAASIYLYIYIKRDKSDIYQIHMAQEKTK